MRPPSPFPVSRSVVALAVAMAVFGASVFATLAAPASASAQDPMTEAESLEWDPRWRRADIGDYLLIGALGWVALTAQIALIPDVANYQSGFLIDDFVHETFGIAEPVTRETIDNASDVLQWLLFFYPLVVDTMIITVIGDDWNWDVGWQLFTINTLSVAATLAFNWFTKNAVARERPYVQHCREDPQSDFECSNVDRNRSFYSGHTAFAATGAGLICMHHSRLPLYDGIGDDIACGVAIGVAGGIALMRILADRHWFSDVFVGAVAGVISGVLLPWFLRYGFDDTPL